MSDLIRRSSTYVTADATASPILFPVDGVVIGDLLIVTYGADTLPTTATVTVSGTATYNGVSVAILGQDETVHNGAQNLHVLSGVVTSTLPSGARVQVTLTGVPAAPAQRRCLIESVDPGTNQSWTGGRLDRVSDGPIIVNGSQWTSAWSAASNIDGSAIRPQYSINAAVVAGSANATTVNLGTGFTAVATFPTAANTYKVVSLAWPAHSSMMRTADFVTWSNGGGANKVSVNLLYAVAGPLTASGSGKSASRGSGEVIAPLSASGSGKSASAGRATVAVATPVNSTAIRASVFLAATNTVTFPATNSVQLGDLLVVVYGAGFITTTINPTAKSNGVSVATLSMDATRNDGVREIYVWSGVVTTTPTTPVVIALPEVGSGQRRLLAESVDPGTGQEWRDNRKDRAGTTAGTTTSNPWTSDWGADGLSTQAQYSINALYRGGTSTTETIDPGDGLSRSPLPGGSGSYHYLSLAWPTHTPAMRTADFATWSTGASSPKVSVNVLYTVRGPLRASGTGKSISRGSGQVVAADPKTASGSGKSASDGWSGAATTVEVGTRTSSGSGKAASRGTATGISSATPIVTRTASGSGKTASKGTGQAYRPSLLTTTSGSGKSATRGSAEISVIDRGDNSPLISTSPTTNKTTIPITPILPLPYAITNLLSDEQQSISGIQSSEITVSGWTVGTACTLSSSTLYQKYDPASLQMVATSNAETAFIHSGNSETDYITIQSGIEYRAFAWIRTEATRRDVQIGIEWTVNGVALTWDPDTDSSIYSIGVIDGWKLVSYIGTSPTSDTTVKARIRIELPDAGPIATPPLPYQTVWIDNPVLAEHRQILSGFTRLVYRRIPEYLRLLDTDDTTPNTPMARYIDLIGATANRILNAAVAFDYIPEKQIAPGYQRSTLVDPNFYITADIAEERWLPWLAFITGTRPYVSTTFVGGISTPWFQIEILARPSGSLTPTWNALENYGPPPAGTKVTWNTLETANPVPEDATAPIRESIRSQGTGLYAGTIEGLKRATRLVLGATDTFDLPASMIRTNGITTVTFASPISIVNGAQITCYDSNISEVNQTQTVINVSTDKRTIKFLTTPQGVNITEPYSVYVTNKKVNIIPNRYAFSGSITGSNVDSSTLTITSGEALPPVFVGPFTVTGGGAYNGIYTPTSFSISSDRKILTLTMGSAVPTAATTYGVGISTPSSLWSLTIQTLQSQTIDKDIVLKAAYPAKPVGCVLSHQYIL